MVPLSASNGTYALGPEDQTIMCLLSDGRLLVTTSAKLNPRVTMFEARLRRQNESYQIEYVDPSAIRDAYNVGRKGDSRSRTNIQTEAMDLFQEAVRARASDIHIRISTTGTKILFRVHSVLIPSRELDTETGKRLTSVIYQTLTEVKDTNFNENGRQDARISDKAVLPEGVEGIRVATSPQASGSVMVLRLLYDDATTKLDLSAKTVKNLKAMTAMPTGINLISGPTGSGKSTTLQRTLIGAIRESNESINVITVEDPPEYPIPGAIQTPVTSAVTEEERSVAFQQAIKTSMRLDPDVIMIGEMRDPPSAKLSIEAAMTGHQVWGSIHANSAIGILDRLIDLGVPPQFAYDPSIVSGLVSQRLLKLLCSCKVPLLGREEHYDQESLERVIRMVPDIASVHVKGPGCELCNHTGTKGRVAVTESIITDEQFMSYLRQQNKIEAIKYWLNVKGGETIIQDTVTKISEGLVDPFEAERVVGQLRDNTLSL